MGVLIAVIGFAAACSSQKPAANASSAGEPSTTATNGTLANAMSAPATASTSSLDALPPPQTDTNAKPRQSLTMSDSRATVDPSTNAIPSPPATIDVPPQAGVDAAIKAVPNTVPVGSLSKGQLEAPLRDRARFEHCRIPYGTHGEIAAVIYNGAALGVDVKTKPNDRALNFCIERAVRQMTWVKELAVNKVKVGF
jgi:hypothetical protein